VTGSHEVRSKECDEIIGKVREIKIEGDEIMKISTHNLYP
jgi:hypothetical protein